MPSILWPYSVPNIWDSKINASVFTLSLLRKMSPGLSVKEKGVWIPGMISRTEGQGTNLGMAGPEMLGYSQFLMQGLDGLCEQSGKEAWSPGSGWEENSSSLD